MLQKIGGENIPRLNIQFVTVSEIAKVHDNWMIDVVAVVHEVCETEEQMCRNQVSKLKRNVLLVDSQRKIVTLTLWGDKVELFEGVQGKVCGITNVSVGNYMGKKILNSTPSTGMTRDVDRNVIKTLQAFYKEGGEEEIYDEISAK